MILCDAVAKVLKVPMIKKDHVISSEILSPLAGLRHGFFTRQGGVSSGIYGSLNAGAGSKDDPQSILENRARIATFLGAKTDHLLSPFQVHSNDIAIIDKPFTERPKVDALVTKTPKLALGILTADCGPLLFADTENRVIGAAHAGWKGAVHNIMAATVEAMEAIGAKRQNIHAILGPTISQKHYEVGVDFEDNFLALSPEAQKFFVAGTAPDKRQFDLPSFILASLNALNIKSATWTGHCTYEDEAKFFSFRRTTHRSEIDYGRQIATIMLEE